MAANVITRGDGWSNTLSEGEKLWAARMIAGEAGDPVAVLWTMASRFALLESYATFATLLRAYSQPINPKWQRGGEACGARCGLAG